MLLRDVPQKAKFRFLIDLEPGETVEQLPVFQKLVVDFKIKKDLTVAFLDTYSLCYLDGIVTPVRNNTDVEIVP